MRSITSDRGAGKRVQLAAELLDLVAELRGVLEAELLRGDVHLLLERDDELLDLVPAHPRDLLLAAPAAARDGGRLEREELRDVGDALHDRLRRDALLGVVGELRGATAVRLLERALDRLGQLVRVPEDGAVDVPRRP